MKLTLTSPTELEVEDLSEGQIKDLSKYLTYTNTSAEHELYRLKSSPWFASKYGREAWLEMLAEKKANVKQCLLKQRSDGSYYTYSGLSDKVSKYLNIPIVNKVKYPDTELLAWNKAPTKKIRPFQGMSKERLINIKHGGVEIGTGLGKTRIISELVKEYGLKTIILAPSISIVEQLYKDFVDLFGTKKVGRCYDGKKDYKKLITIALPQTLINFKEDSEHYKELSKVQLFIADESHTLPAKTLASVCFGLVKNAPYRFFFSATQMRNDGADLLLDSIVGPIIFTMTVKEGVDQGYLAKPVFKMIPVLSSSSFFSKDANAMTRKHLYYNQDINIKAAKLANSFVEHMDHQVIIMIDEIEQFAKLYPYLKYKPAFAHGTLNEKQKSTIPKDFWDSDPTELVKQFNEGKIPILIGTSCIAMGTDFLPVKSIIYLVGGKSETQVKQAVGRGTRMVEGKNTCNFIDFDIKNVPMIHKHSVVRKEIYDSIYGPVTELRI